jgi:hypothetical protein
MRLLHVGAKDELNLTEFSSGNVPPYAILSHTWGEDDSEVTYQDVKAGMGKEKAGYNKIRQCGQHAAKNNLSYFWVDTCCIRNVAQLTTPYDSGGYCRQKGWAPKF